MQLIVIIYKQSYYFYLLSLNSYQQKLLSGLVKVNRQPPHATTFSNTHILKFSHSISYIEDFTKPDGLTGYSTSLLFLLAKELVNWKVKICSWAFFLRLSSCKLLYDPLLCPTKILYISKHPPACLNC